MNAKLLVFISSFFIGLTLSSQNIGINSTGANAHASALLDVDAAPSNDRGLLVPRIPLTAINVAAPVTSPATSLLVYNTASASTGTNAVSPGYYYWDGVKWVRFAYTPSGSSSEAWTLFGNSGTNSTSNFIGTIDAQDLVFRTNNLEAVRINTVGNVGIGTNLPNARLYLKDNLPNASVDLVIENASASGQKWVLESVSTFTNITNGSLLIGNRTTSQNHFAITPAGYTGIGICTPETQLDVAGTGQVWIRKATGGGLPVTAGEGLKIESNINGGLLQAYDYSTSAPKNIIMQTVGGYVGINTTSPNGLLANNSTNFGALSNGCNNYSLNWTNASTSNGWVGTFSSNGPHGLLASTTGTTSSEIPFAVTSGTFNSILGSRQNDNLLIVKGSGNIGIGTSNPTFKLHVVDGSIAQTKTTNASHSIYMGNSSGRNWQLYHLGSLDANAPNGFMFEHFDGSVWQRRVTIDQTGNVGIGVLSPTTKLHVASTTSNTAFRMQDGTEGLGKVLRSDASGNASWSEPAGLANYPYQSIGTLPVGASCPAGGTYSTSTITLPAGIYIFQHYSCAGQIGQLVTGLNVYINIVSGSGDASGTWHDFNGGSCGHYYTGVLRCFTPCTVNRVYQSYGGSSFSVPGANSESTTFIKIL